MQQRVASVRVAGPTGSIALGGGAPLVLIAGPCVIEERDRVLRIADGLAEVCGRLGLPLIFKSSFDKANRTSGDAFRGPGLDRGLRVLCDVRDATGLPVTTDVHLPGQARAVGEAVELLQIPAFLCRQTDLLEACAATGRPVNLKKGQFLSPSQVGPAVAKLEAAGSGGVLVTERGSSFGYHDLVVDMRSLFRIRALGVPVCFDGTHAVQAPGALGGASGGHRELVGPLVRAATAAGIDALFLEVHDDPAVARSDGPCQVPLDQVERLLRAVVAIDAAARATA
jgi:2-dehydro-3-deoxyphosphooctonate aldolase (KDO 8-P synthase)